MFEANGTVAVSLRLMDHVRLAQALPALGTKSPGQLGPQNEDVLVGEGLVRARALARLT